MATPWYSLIHTEAHSHSHSHSHSHHSHSHSHTHHTHTAPYRVTTVGTTTSYEVRPHRHGCGLLVHHVHHASPWSHGWQPWKQGTAFRRPPLATQRHGCLGHQHAQATHVHAAWMHRGCGHRPGPNPTPPQLRPPKTRNYGCHRPPGCHAQVHHAEAPRLPVHVWPWATPCWR